MVDIGSIGGALGIEEETMADIAGYVETGQELYGEASSAYGDVMGAIKQGQATLQDLGLLPTPKGEPAGGRWGMGPGGEPAYFPPDHVFGMPGIGSFPIAELPQWIPLGLFPGIPEIGHRTLLWWRLGGDIEQIERIAGLDPISGIAPPGTAFESLSPEDKRRYIANSYAIGIAKNVYKPIAVVSTISQLKERQRMLGWKAPGTAGFAMKQVDIPGVIGRSCQGSVLSPDGTPFMVINCDQDEAARRVLGVVRGTVPIDGSGQQVMVGQLAIENGGEPWRECFAPGVEGSEQAACIERHEGEAGLSEFMDQFFSPWREVATPGKLLQFVTGIDGKDYAVLEVGGKQHGYGKWAFIAATGAALTAGAVSTAGLGYLLLTKKGKKLRKKWMK